jgi:hypothetical protein
MQVEQVTADLMASHDQEWPYCAALDYLRLHGWLGLAFAWARTARLAAPKQKETFYKTKSETARFVYDYLLINVRQTAEAVKAGQAPLPPM